MAVVERLVALPCVVECECLMAYLALPAEVNVDLLLRARLCSERRVAVPVTVLAERRIEVVQLHGLDGGLIQGPMGIREPEGNLRVPLDPALIDVMVVPGVAFDEFGGRLGYGGGFYDRLWPALRQDAILIGVALEEQVVRELPMEEHDMRVGLLVTPQRVVACTGDY